MSKSLVFIALLGFGCVFASGLADDESKLENTSSFLKLQTSDVDASCHSLVNFGCSDKVSEYGVQSIKSDYSGSSVVVQNNGANNSYIDSNNYKFNRNATANFNITDSNQTLLQSYTPVVVGSSYSPSELIKNNLSVPIKTGDNSSIQVTPEKVEFNLKY